MNQSQESTPDLDQIREDAREQGRAEALVGFYAISRKMPGHELDAREQYFVDLQSKIDAQPVVVQDALRTLTRETGLDTEYGNGLEAQGRVLEIAKGLMALKHERTGEARLRRRKDAFGPDEYKKRVAQEQGAQAGEPISLDAIEEAAYYLKGEAKPTHGTIFSHDRRAGTELAVEEAADQSDMNENPAEVSTEVIEDEAEGQSATASGAATIDSETNQGGDLTEEKVQAMEAEADREEKKTTLQRRRREKEKQYSNQRFYGVRRALKSLRNRLTDRKRSSRPSEESSKGLYAQRQL